MDWMKKMTADAETPREWETHEGAVLAAEEDGLLIQEADMPFPLKLHLLPDAAVLDGGTGLPAEGDFVPGEPVRVWASRAQTRSIPPQCRAAAVIRRLPEGAMQGSFHQIDLAEKEEDLFCLFDAERKIILSAAAETPVLSALGEPLPPEALLTSGEIAAWYDAVALSLPARARILRAVVLRSRPDGEEEIDAGQ